MGEALQKVAAVKVFQDVSQQQYIFAYLSLVRHAVKQYCGEIGSQVVVHRPGCEVPTSTHHVRKFIFWQD